MKQDKTIIVFINTFSFFVTHRYDLILSLSEKSNVIICTDLESFQPCQIKKYETKKIKFINLRIRRSSLNIFHFIKEVRVIKNIIKKVKPQHILFISMKFIFFGNLLLAFGILNFYRVFFIFSGLGFLYTSNKYSTLLIRNIFEKVIFINFSKKNNFHIFQNYEDKDYFCNKGLISKSKAKIILGNGINLSEYSQKKYNYPKSTLKILFTGRIIKDKGVELIRNLALYFEDTLKFEFHIWGDIDNVNNTKLSDKEFADLRKIKNLFLHEALPREKMPELYRSNDIFILPSKREGLSRSSIEAASSGMPLLLSNVPGCREVIFKNKNGFLVSVDNNFEWINKLEFFYENQEYIEKMGRFSRKLSEDLFENKKIFNEYHRILELDK